MRIPVLACAGALCALLPMVPPMDPQDVTDSGDQVILSFGDEGERLADVLKAFGTILGQPVDFLPDEVSAVSIHMEGPVTFAKSEARDVLDGLLARQGFWSWDDVSGGTSQLVVRLRKPRGVAGPSALSFTPRLIDLQELEAGPSPRLPLYSVVFRLEHLTARDQLATFMSTLNVQTEIIRAVEDDALLVTASREHLLQVRDTLAQLDKPPRDAPAISRLAAVEERLAAIEARLQVLEAKAGS